MKTKRLLSLLLVFAMMLSLAPAVFAADDAFVAPFTDVPTNGYYAQAVAWAVENNITKGTSETTFSPDVTCTRAEVVTFLWRAQGSPAPSDTQSAFTDVQAGAYYYDAMLWAVENGITKGTSATNFTPNNTCTRAEVVTFLHRAKGTPEPIGTESAFTDVQAGAYYYDAMLWAVENGITKGTSATIFAPNNTCTRAEIVTFLYRSQSIAVGDLVYGTATLTYGEFYAGDVSSTDAYDAITSATNTKYGTLKNAYTDFVDAETNADGYHILGVQNVNVAVAASDVEAYTAINPTFTVLEEEPAQYKLVTVSNGKAAYSATQYNVVQTITNATAELQTGSVWGDYQINVTDPEGVSILRNSRDDNFPVNSYIQGIILETASGLKVGMEYLQSIWVQPYEVSFNVSKDNTHNTHITQWDNVAELDKLEGETVTKITYIMPDGVYVYEFAGIYIKPIYTGTVSGTVAADQSVLTLNQLPEGLENAVLTVTYTIGSGREATKVEVYSGAVAETVALDVAKMTEAGEGGVISAAIGSDNFATINVTLSE